MALGALAALQAWGALGALHASLRVAALAEQRAPTTGGEKRPSNANGVESGQVL